MEFIELLASARQGVGSFGNVQKGDEVLIVADTRTVDPWVVEAMKIAAHERGAFVVTMILPPPVAWADAWPEMTVKAALEADVLVRLGGRSIVHSGIREAAREKGKPFILKANVTHREHLASEYGRYPYKILQEISRQLYKAVRGKKRYRVTDALGTDIMIELPDSSVEGLPHGLLGRVIQQDKGADRQQMLYLDWPGATCGFTFSNDKSEGVLVSRATHFGQMPEMKMTVQGGRVINIEGGGMVGDSWRRAVAEFSDVDFKKRPGPGVNWIEEIMWGLQPKAPIDERPSIQTMTTGLSSRSTRVIHIAMGAGYGSHHHRDVEMDDPDVWVEGEKIIEHGRLLVLDDPAVRDVAKEFGDPDTILAEL